MVRRRRSDGLTQGVAGRAQAAEVKQAEAQQNMYAQLLPPALAATAYNAGPYPGQDQGGGGFMPQPGMMPPGGGMMPPQGGYMHQGF